MRVPVRRAIGKLELAFSDAMHGVFVLSVQFLAVSLGRFKAEAQHGFNVSSLAVIVAT
jgi:hypothetical protein